MLAAEYKITSQEFNNFFKKGIKKSSKRFRISVILDANGEKPKYAVVISKKVLKTAVSRHENKRKIYKIIRQLYPQFLTLKYGFIFIQQDIRTVSEDILIADLKDLLSSCIKK